MTESEAGLLAYRAERLALLLFLRRSDLEIVEPDVDSRLDLIIRLRQEQQLANPIFGVEVKAHHSLKAFKADLLHRDWRRESEQWLRDRDIEFPVFLFVFLMDDDSGYYCWINGQSENTRDVGGLTFNRFRRLGSEEIDNIVRAVREWYGKRQETYRASIGGEWTVDDFSDLFAPYSQVYAFLRLLRAPPVEPAERSRLAGAYRSHPWQGGYSRVNFFSELKSLVPAPEVVSLQYASPGWIELGAFLPTAYDIRSSIHNYAQSRDKIESLMKDTNRMLRERDLTKRNLQSPDFWLSAEDIELLHEAIGEFSHLLGFEHLDRLSEWSQNPLVALKVLMAFCVRIERLAEYQLRKMITY